MSGISYHNADNFIRNLVTVMDGRPYKLSVPPISKTPLTDAMAANDGLPVSIEDIALDLRVDDLDDERETIRRFTLFACDFIEQKTAMVITPGRYEIILPCFPTSPIFFKRAPLRSIEGIEYMSGRDVWEVVSPDDYYARSFSKNETVMTFVSDFQAPDLWTEMPQVKITLAAGFLSDNEVDSALSVPGIPDGLRTCMTAMVAHIYKNRELFEADKAGAVAQGLGSILSTYRTFW